MKITKQKKKKNMETQKNGTFDNNKTSTEYVISLRDGVCK